MLAVSSLIPSYYGCISYFNMRSLHESSYANYNILPDMLPFLIP